MDLHNNLVSVALPTELTVGGRSYDILALLREGEMSVVVSTMVERAKEMSTHLGQEDGQHLLDNQKDIPAILRGNVAFVFTDWHLPDDPEYVCRVSWNGARWVRDWFWLGGHWDDDQVLRRK